MSTDEIATESNTDIYRPVNAKGEPLLWLDGNRAKILGLLDETSAFYEREGLLEPLLQFGAAMVGSRIAITDKKIIPFIEGEAIDPKPYGLRNRPGDINVRIKDASDHATLTGKVEYDFSTQPAVDLKTYSLSALHVKTEQSKLLRSLKYVFGHCEKSEALLTKAKGVGFAFVEALGQVQDVDGAQRSTVVEVEEAE